MDRLKMHTPDIAEENYRKLAALFPDAVTETIDDEGNVVRAIDKDVLMQEINAQVVDDGQERYQFTWPDKRRSIVLANAPIAKTLRFEKNKSVGRDGTPGGTDSENIYIEGDNLDALKLLQETYLGKVKMIYIDPPYNTGNDFIYEDDFSQSASTYAENSGQTDEEGNRLVQNTEGNGRFHTDWLNMLYPRLKIAKDLLTKDGLIFISIDDNELTNLRKICNEIFGEKCFVAQITLLCNPKGRSQDKYVANCHEYVLIFSKNMLEKGSVSIPKSKDENRKFILIQIDEQIDKSTDAYKAGYKTICDIGEERIRRAGKKIKEETGADIDYGFRCFKVDSSNMKDVYYRPADIGQMNLDDYTDNIKEDRTSEDLLIQVMLDLGVELSSKVEQTESGGKKVFSVADGYLIACFDKDVTEDVVTEVAKRHPFYFVSRDSSMANDSVAANFEEIFKTYSPETVRKVL
mgnify:CR=1 FL=1